MDLTGAVWRKSSRSGDNGGYCVEVAAVWRKSSRSADNGGNCVELSGCACGIAVRDSKDPAGPALAFPVAAWRAFTGDVRGGRFDLT
jgi:hypothetical protein